MSSHISLCLTGVSGLSDTVLTQSVVRLDRLRRLACDARRSDSATATRLRLVNIPPLGDRIRQIAEISSLLIYGASSSFSNVSICDSAVVRRFVSQAQSSASARRLAAGGMVASLMTLRERGIVVAVISNASYADTAAMALKIAEAFAAPKVAGK